MRHAIAAGHSGLTAAFQEHYPSFSSFSFRPASRNQDGLPSITRGSNRAIDCRVRTVPRGFVTSRGSPALSGPPPPGRALGFERSAIRRERANNRHGSGLADNTGAMSVHAFPRFRLGWLSLLQLKEFAVAKGVLPSLVMPG